jgi:hypothetical protein
VPPVADRSKGRGQTKCSPWSSRFGVRSGAKDPGKIYYCETMQGSSTSEDEMLCYCIKIQVAA